MIVETESSVLDGVEGCVAREREPWYFQTRAGVTRDQRWNLITERGDSWNTHRAIGQWFEAYYVYFRTSNFDNLGV